MSQTTRTKKRSVMCIAVDSEIKEYLENKAKEREMSLSELIREIIYDYVIKTSQ